MVYSIHFDNKIKRNHMENLTICPSTEGDN